MVPKAKHARLWLDYVAPGYLDSFNGAVTAKTKLSTLSGGMKLLQEIGLLSSRTVTLMCTVCGSQKDTVSFS